MGAVGEGGGGGGGWEMSPTSTSNMANASFQQCSLPLEGGISLVSNTMALKVHAPAGAPGRGWAGGSLSVSSVALAYPCLPVVYQGRIRGGTAWALEAHAPAGAPVGDGQEGPLRVPERCTVSLVYPGLPGVYQGCTKGCQGGDHRGSQGAPHLQGLLLGVGRKLHSHTLRDPL